jgi:hypothetical protein
MSDQQERIGSSIWAVTYGEEIAALYSNEQAAQRHVQAESGTDVSEWEVRDEYQS